MLQMDNSTVNYKYELPDDYNLRYVNGAYGGISPQGEIILNLFMERLPVPKEQTYELKQAGEGTLEVGQVISETNPPLITLIRHIQTGVIMNLDSARRIRNFLDSTLKAYDEAKRQHDG
jgi:hypothetical protein